MGRDEWYAFEKRAFQTAFFLYSFKESFGVPIDSPRQDGVC